MALKKDDLVSNAEWFVGRVAKRFADGKFKTTPDGTEIGIDEGAYDYVDMGNEADLLPDRSAGGSFWTKDDSVWVDAVDAAAARHGLKRQTYSVQRPSAEWRSNWRFYRPARAARRTCACAPAKRRSARRR